MATGDHANVAMEKLKLDKDTVLKHYNEALTWADEQTTAAMG